MDQDITLANEGSNRVMWIAAGALACAAAIALFLYADGFFAANAGTAGEPRTIIEAKK